MKKWMVALLGILVIFFFTACGNQKENNSDDINTEVSDSKGSALQENLVTDKRKLEDRMEKKSSTAVVYFSATGTTKEVAGTIAEVLGTEAVEIIPQEEYSSEDLDYNNDNCRANKEMNDDSSRPAIKNDLSEVKECDTVYVGYPIWWGTAPRIIQTFFETYDLSGKTVYLFCTSGGSGIEQSVQDLQEKYKDINIVSGKRFSEGVSREEIREWMNEKE